jgi:thioredoxin reductase
MSAPPRLQKITRQALALLIIDTRARVFIARTLLQTGLFLASNVRIDSLQRRPMDRDLLDVIIVGGGPAGLSAALVLGRCRRRAIVFDAGHPRNEASHALHGYLTRDGIPPAEFLQIGREQLARYDTIELRPVKVMGVERGDARFTVTIAGGEQFSARMLLLATGLVDELPQIEGFRKFYGVSAHNCPYCDGWEHRDQPLAVLGCNKDAADLALELLLWSKDVILCTNGAPECGRDVLDPVKRNGVRIVDKRIKCLEGTGDKLERIRFDDGTEMPRTAVFFSPGQHQRSPLAEQLGCDFCKDDGCIQCGENAATNVPGVYASGNATRGVQLVIAAAAEGMQAAFAINTALLEADAKQQAVLKTSVAGESQD